jgi:hypothetical protein
MLVETKVLAEVIRHAPIGSYWYITSDSWEGIKEVFDDFIVEQEGDWRIEVLAGNRAFLCQKIIEADMGELAVHMTLELSDGSCLFRSYDRMVMVVIKKELYAKLKLLDLPADFGIEVE